MWNQKLSRQREEGLNWVLNLKNRNPTTLNQMMKVRFSVALKPRLSLVWLGFGSSFWSKSSTRLGSVTFSKSSVSKNSANTSFLRLPKKIIGKAPFWWEKFQVFLSTMAFKGHFQPQDWSKISKICQKWPSAVHTKNTFSILKIFEGSY